MAVDVGGGLIDEAKNKAVLESNLLPFGWDCNPFKTQTSHVHTQLKQKYTKTIEN